jgi:hypothetical protein
MPSAYSSIYTASQTSPPELSGKMKAKYYSKSWKAWNLERKEMNERKKNSYSVNITFPVGAAVAVLLLGETVELKN